jgi:hypothetical protein
MRHLRRTVLATLAIALCAAPATGAQLHQDGAVVAPARGGGLTGGELLGEAWAHGLVLPAGEDPFSGSCTTLARNVLVPHLDDAGAAKCTATPATRLFVYFGSECSDVEGPVFAQTEEEQLACAVASDQAIHELNITVDNGDTINLVGPRFELFSPQRTIGLPADNVFGVPAQTATFTAHAWGAVIRNLHPGQHTVIVEVVAPDFGGTFTFTITLNVIPGPYSGAADHGDRAGDDHE